jgi:hypothetical protein
MRFVEHAKSEPVVLTFIKAAESGAALPLLYATLKRDFSGRDKSADVLRARIEAARQRVQEASGCPVQIDRLEPMEHAGKAVLRVFWRKVQLH